MKHVTVTARYDDNVGKLLKKVSFYNIKNYFLTFVVVFGAKIQIFEKL